MSDFSIKEAARPGDASVSQNAPGKSLSDSVGATKDNQNAFKAMEGLKGSAGGNLPSLELTDLKKQGPSEKGDTAKDGGSKDSEDKVGGYKDGGYKDGGSKDSEAKDGGCKEPMSKGGSIEDSLSTPEKRSSEPFNLPKDSKPVFDLEPGAKLY